MGGNISKDISSEITQQIHSQKCMRTHRKGLYQGCSKNCEILNLKIVPHIFRFR